MTIVDAGPLIALLDRDEPDHQACVRVMRSMRSTMVTSWAALAEAMYLLGSQLGWSAQEALWRLVLDKRLMLVHGDDELLRRSFDLMARYRDTPMDLADATLVAIAERLGTRRVFTLDSDFRVYRLNGKHAMEIVPQVRSV